MERDTLADVIKQEAEEASASVPPVDLQDVVGRAPGNHADLRRRMPTRLLVAAVVLIAIAVPVARLWSDSSPRQTASNLPGTTLAQSPALGRLLHGSWAALRAAPSPIGAQAAVAWTGTELVVWGGFKGEYGDGPPTSAGEEYDPSTGRWTELPPAPLKAAGGASAVWTGSQVIIAGGGTESTVYDQAAAFDPTTGTWRELPAPPLSAREQMSGFWSGSAAIFLGGDNADRHWYDDGASYSPGAGTWTHVAGPSLPAGHPLDWPTYVQAGAKIIDFSAWLKSFTTGDGGGSNSGVDTFVYDAQNGAWRRLPTPSGRSVGPPAAPIQGVGTGQAAVVQGVPYNCGDCPGPAVSDVTAVLHLADDRWTSAVPANAVGHLQPTGAYYPDYSGAAWLGASMFAYVTQTGNNGNGPAVASLYDPVTNRWRLLPTAPFSCGSGGGTDPVTWTGTQVIVLCAPSRGKASGLVFKLAPAP